MANRIKRNIDIDEDSLNIGEWSIGLPKGMGPTETTGFYHGVEIPEGGYAIYSENIDARIAYDESDLVYIIQKMGANIIEYSEALEWAKNNDILILNNDLEDITTDALMIYIDANHTYSHIYAPKTTNHLIDGHFPNGQDMPQESGSNPNNKIIHMPDNPGSSEYVLQQTVGSIYTEYQVNLTSQLKAGTTYVLSGWYAESLNYSGSSRMFHARAYSAAGAHVSTGAGIYNVIKTRIINGITWKYCYVTMTMPSDYSNNFNWYIGYNGDTYSGARHYTNIQIEEGTYPTPFVNGTRTTNNTIYNLAKSSGINSMSLYGNISYGDISGNVVNLSSSNSADSNGCILRSTQSIASTVNGDFTTMGWIKRTTSNSAELMSYRETWQRLSLEILDHGIFFNQRETSDANGNGSYNTFQTRVFVTNSRNVWEHFTLSKSGNQWSFYKNGQLIRTNTFNLTETISGTGFHIGAAWPDDDYLGRVMNGSVGPVMHYTKALTASEILQNYKAHKLRY